MWQYVYEHICIYVYIYMYIYIQIGIRLNDRKAAPHYSFINSKAKKLTKMH